MQAELADQVNYALRALAQRHRARAGVLLADLDLYPGQEFVLKELATQGPMIQSKIATAINCEPPTVTHIVKKLEAAGLVTRTPSPSDGRATVIGLTDAGRALISPLQEVWVQLAVDAAGDLSAEELTDAVRLINRLTANLADDRSRPVASAEVH